MASDYLQVVAQRFLTPVGLRYSENAAGVSLRSTSVRIDDDTPEGRFDVSPNPKRRSMYDKPTFNQYANSAVAGPVALMLVFASLALSACSRDAMW